MEDENMSAALDKPASGLIRKGDMGTYRFFWSAALFALKNYFFFFFVIMTKGRPVSELKNASYFWNTAGS